MNITNLLYVTDRQEWREWLKENYQSEEEIWLVYPGNIPGKPVFLTIDAVEEALCFGWIDSITKGIDEDKYAQRFTPRKPHSNYSQTNIERLRRLVDQDMVMSDVLASVSDIISQEYEFPADIVAVLQANHVAWENFQRYSGSYQRIRIAFIDVARNRPGEFEKRLNHFIRKTEQDKQFGFGIEEYY